MDHEIDDMEGMRTRLHLEEDLARLTIAVDLVPGQPLRLTKYLGYGWSSKRSIPAVRAQAEAALTGALQTGWDGLLAEQHEFLDDFWDAADIGIDGDPELQQATRYALFQVLQAGACGESRSIPAKGLTGQGYEGHTFWDTESLVLPLLTYTTPEAARDALRWRHSTLDKAKHRAEVLGVGGAAFPWRSISGAECSAYWPAGTACMHVNAAIADAVARYYQATGDDDFDRDCGTELLVETARLWRSLGHHGSTGSFRIDGVTGPDEYTALINNNTYTNLMAQRNLWEAVRACERQPQVAAELDVSATEVTSWREAADVIELPYAQGLGVHEQSEDFTELAEWDFDATPTENYPLLLNYPYFDLYRRQVVKQADLVLAMYTRGDAFTDEEKQRNFAYYDARTSRDSSLSAPVQSVLAAETGHDELAYDYLVETALTDVNDLHGNVRSGLHLGALAGVWTAVVAGFGGMRDHGGELTFAPRLPPALKAVSFRMRVRDTRFSVRTTPDDAEYRLVSGKPLNVAHYGEPITIDSTEPRVMPIPEQVRPEPAWQPPGREPRDRGDYESPDPTRCK